MLARRVQTMQIITGALCLGVVVFAAIAIWSRSQNPAAPVETPTTSYVSLPFFAICFVLSFVWPAITIEGHLKTLASAGGSVTEGQLADLRQTTLIIGNALLEGPAFFGIIAYMSEGHLWSLAPALIGVALMASRLPTETGLSEWIENQGRRIKEIREGR